MMHLNSLTARFRALPSHRRRPFRQVIPTVLGLEDRALLSVYAYDSSITAAVNQTYSGSVSYSQDNSPADPLVFDLESYASEGTATVNSDGTFSYTPNTDYVGSDSFMFNVYDEIDETQSATATVSITVANVAPVANPALFGGAINQNIYGSLSASDPNNLSLTYSVVSGPSNGSFSYFGGDFGYTPNSDFTGTDSFTYQVSNDTYVSNVATVTLQISVPVTYDDSFTMGDSQDYFGSLGGDAWSPDGVVLTFTIVSGPSHGTLLSFDSSDGSFEYEAGNEYSGSDSFTFEVTEDSDGIPYTSNVSTMSITIPTAFP